MRARLVFSILLLLALAFPALAQDRRGGLDRVLPQVSRTVPGTFYDAEGPFFSPDGRAMYRIKWMLPDGRIVWLNVDAQSGQIIGGMPPIGQSTRRFREEDDRDRRNNWGGGQNNGGGDRGGWGRGGGRGGDWGDRGGGGGNGSGNGGRGSGDRGWGQGGRGGDHGGDRGGNRGGHDRRGGG